MTELDNTNKMILSVLRNQGRITNLDLANKVDLSASACLRRVQDLERTGIIKGYRAIIDEPSEDNNLIVFVMVGLSGHLKKDSKAFEQAMEAYPQVRECHNISGNIEFMLRVEVPDLEAFKKFHADVLGTMPQVSSITSHFCLGTSKDKSA